MPRAISNTFSGLTTTAAPETTSGKELTFEDTTGVRHATEVHELGLFTEDETRAAFAAAGLRVVHETESPSNRGLFVARSDMATWLRWLSDALPLTYAYDALARVAGDGPYGARFSADVGVVVGAVLVALALGAATLRRRTP